MKKRILTLFLAICMICTLLPFSAFAKCYYYTSYSDLLEYSDNDMTGEFTYYSQFTKDAETYSYSFDESCFSNSSMNYQQNLARMSLRMAMSAYDMNDAGKLKGDRSAGIRDLFNKLGFNYRDKNETDTQKSSDTIFYPESGDNTVGYAIGSMRIVCKDGKVYTLIAVAPRSGNYTQEWAGNFMVGSSTEHKGFATAADKVYESVKKYIKDNKIDSNIKIWIAGYSRGAAVSNILAQRLTSDAINGKIKGLSQKNIFAYCFECPQTVRTNDSRYKGNAYKNIINIVNPIDFVTKVAPSAWNYSRYGVTYLLPSAETSYNSFKKSFGLMTDNYNKILSKSGTKSPKAKAIEASAFFVGQGMFLDGLLDLLACTMTINPPSTNGPKNYETHYQSKFMKLGRDFGGGKSLDKILLDAFALIPNFNKYYPGVVAKTITEGHYIAHAHYPELCLAWIDTIKDASEFVDAHTRKLIFNCPIDVTVTDSNGKIVAKITDDVAKEISDSNIAAYVDEDGQKTVILPCDEQFNISLKATDNGTMSYQIEEVNVDNGSVERIKGYYDVKIKKNDKLTGIVENLTECDNVKYALKDTKGKSITPSVDDKKAENTEYSVKISAIDGAEISGGGVYTYGEYANVTAGVCEGYTFKGWYEKDNLLTTDSSYRFRVEKNHDLVAKYQKNKLAFKDVSKDAYYYEPVSWAYFHKPQITAGVDKTHFAPDNNCTRGQIVTFLWRANGCPEVKGIKNPFKDVKSSDYYYKAVLWAVKNGITNGVDKTHFAPNNSCARGQAVTFLWRANENPKAASTKCPFKDVKSSDYYYKAVLWAVGKNITNGMDKTHFAPNNTCTRGQIVTFLYRDLK